MTASGSGPALPHQNHERKNHQLDPKPALRDIPSPGSILDGNTRSLLSGNLQATGSFAALDWHFGQDQKQRVHVKPRLFCSSYDAVIGAALDGWGLARVLSYQIGEHLVAGRLQTVLADFEQEPLPIHIVHPEGRRASAKVRAFIDLAAERLRANRLIN